VNKRYCNYWKQEKSTNQLGNTRFEVLVAMKIQVEFFWVLMPSSVAVGYQHFMGPCYLHQQGKVKM
jgi:hypothetical protein